MQSHVSSGVTTSTFMIGSRACTAPSPAFAERRTSGDFEGENARIDGVIVAVDQAAPDRSPGSRREPGLREAARPFSTPGMKYSRHRAADDLAPRSCSPDPAHRRLEHHLDAGELGPNPRLLLWV